MGVRWCHLANKMLKSEERLSMFHDVVKFVTQEASLATDPVFSPEALKEARKNEFTNTTNSSNSGRRVKSASSFSTNATPPEEQLPPSSSCRFCNSQHHSLENCSGVKRKTVKEKHLFKKQEYSYSHMSRCWNQKVCKTCSMPHPTVLHDEIKISPKHNSKDQARAVHSTKATSSCTSTCNATETTNTITNSMLVPVRIYQHALWTQNPWKSFEIIHCKFTDFSQDFHG